MSNGVQASSEATPSRRPSVRALGARVWGWALESVRSLGTFAIGLILALIVEVVIINLQSPYFFETENITNIGRAMAIIGIAAVGATIVMISGGFDLSVGSRPPTGSR